MPCCIIIIIIIIIDIYYYIASVLQRCITQWTAAVRRRRGRIRRLLPAAQNVRTLIILLLTWMIYIRWQLQNWTLRINIYIISSVVSISNKIRKYLLRVERPTFCARTKDNIITYYTVRFFFCLLRTVNIHFHIKYYTDHWITTDVQSKHPDGVARNGATEILLSSELAQCSRVRDHARARVWEHCCQTDHRRRRRRRRRRWSMCTIFFFPREMDEMCWPQNKSGNASSTETGLDSAVHDII